VKFDLSASAPRGRGVRHRTAFGAMLIAGGVVAMALSACTAPAGSAGSLSASATGSTITIRDPWVRPAAAGAESAAYLTIANAGPADRLVAVKCTNAASAMLHQTATDASGMTGMSMIEDLSIPAGGTVKLEPRGTHVMLTGLRQAFVAGATIELELVFETVGTLTVQAAVASR
jgi:periplasmic copper chaperone A